MTFYQLPLNNTYPWYTFQITLSGVVYSLVIRYNNRSNRYMMDINDPSGNQILSGVVLLINRNLTGQYTTLSLPPGIFFVTDETSQGIQPTQYSFGISNSLWYEDPN